MSIVCDNSLEDHTHTFLWFGVGLSWGCADIILSKDISEGVLEI